MLVTHEPDIAQYARRVVVFKDGKIKKDYQIEDQRDAAEETEESAGDWTRKTKWNRSQMSHLSHDVHMGRIGRMGRIEQ